MLSLSVKKRPLHLHCRGHHSFEGHSNSVPIWTITKSMLSSPLLVVWCSVPHPSVRTLTTSLNHPFLSTIYVVGFIFMDNILQPLQQQVWPCLRKTQYGQAEARALWEFSQPHQVWCSNCQRLKITQRCYTLFNTCYLWKAIFSSRSS